MRGECLILAAYQSESESPIITIGTVENGYCDYHLVTKVGYCDYFCPGPKVVTISVL